MNSFMGSGSCARASAVLETIASTITVLLMVLVVSTTVVAQCTLSSPDTWSLGSSSNWNNGSNWSGGVPNSSGTNVCITDGVSTVSLDIIFASVASLQLASGNALDINPNTKFNVFGSQILNAGAININGGGNTSVNAYLSLPGGATTTLSGGGTVTLNTTTSVGAGNAQLYLQNGTTLVNVDNTIAGEGIIDNLGSTITNQSGGTINANSTGSPLVNHLALEYSQVNNAGLLEATNSGDLQLYRNTINNQGGNITANGANALVELQGATVQGGTFNTLAGGTIQTTTGYSATLDGSTGAGAVTINGAYLTPGNAQTFLRGSIINNGTLQVNGGNNHDAWIYVPVNVSLTGGGTVNLQTGTTGGGGDAFLDINIGGPLTNVNNTIQGEGIIYNNGTTFINGAAGTVWANSTGSPLTTSIQLEYGTVTNNGTFQVSAGDLLWLYTLANFTNYASNTLTGGAYNIYGTAPNPGTLQIDFLGNTGGEIINNAATIYLNGPNSNFVDQSGLDALSNFSNNTGAGSFTITNGRNFTSPGTVDFANAGAVTVGSGSTFTTGGARNYNQSGGSTQLNGTLTAGGGGANFNGGVLSGNQGTVGTINGNVMMAGTIAPAATINGSNAPLTSGRLNINGNYTQTSAGIFNLGIGGLTAGTQFGFLGVSGNAQIDGTLNVNLLNSYFPSSGNTFVFLTTGGTENGTFAFTNGLMIGNGLEFQVVYGSNFVEITTKPIPSADLWLGGTGNWSNGPQWSIGVPQPAFDTIIYSGGNDLVTMDVGSSTVNSLTVGGVSNGFFSTLSDGGTAQTLAITNGLTVGQQGVVNFTGSGSSITAASVSNSGAVTIGPGVTLNLTAQPLGVTSVAAGASWTIGGNFEVGGVANTGFANLSNIAGTVELTNGATQSITPALTIASDGYFDAGNGTSVGFSSVSNFGWFSSGNFGVTGGNNLSFTGGLSNTGTFQIQGTGDLSTMASLTNNGGGTVNVEGGATLTVTGNVLNNAVGPVGIYTSFTGSGGNTINIGGTLMNNGMFGLESAGDVAKVTGAVTNNGLFAATGGSSATFSSTLFNNGQVDLENASSLTVHGATTNNGTLSTSGFGGTGGNTMTFTMLLTNGGSGQIDVNGPNDTLKASGGMVNNGMVTVKNGSTIDPPFFNNLGTLSIDGTSTFVVGTGTPTGPGFIQLANGTYGEMINSATAFGKVNVAGSASLSGTLDVLLSGYNPPVGTSFTFLLTNPNQLSGTYSTILNDIFNSGTEKWVVNYNDTAGSVQLTAAANPTTVPEPGTMILVGSGLLGLAYRVRRKAKC